MTNELILGIIFFALPVITITAFFVAGTIIKMQERNDQRILDAIAAKYAASKAADQKKHGDFMAGINAAMKESDEKLLAIKNCPKWQKLTQEITSEHAAMIKGRNQFNAMMNR
jgi:hypothetical protein|tara:strand:- start:470 stop:808 length:339 start_codon:yes stop_codon:yes gene_type:complete